MQIRIIEIIAQILSRLDLAAIREAQPSEPDLPPDMRELNLFPIEPGLAFPVAFFLDVDRHWELGLSGHFHRTLVNRVFFYHFHLLFF